MLTLQAGAKWYDRTVAPSKLPDKGEEGAARPHGLADIARHNHLA